MLVKGTFYKKMMYILQLWILIIWIQIYYIHCLENVVKGRF